MTDITAVARTWALGGSVATLVVNRRGDRAAVGLSAGGVVLVEASDLADDLVWLANPQAPLRCLVADADDHAFLLADETGALTLLDYYDAEIGTTPLLVEAALTHVATAAGARRAYSYGAVVVLLDDTGVPSLSEKMPSPVTALAFSPDGERLAVGGADGLTVITVASRERKTWALPTPPRRIVWSVQGTVVMVVCDNGKAFVLHPEAEQTLALDASVAAWMPSGDFLLRATPSGLVAQPCRAGVPQTQGLIPLDDGGTVTHLAPHPTEPLCAAVYADGRVTLAPLNGRREILLLPACGKPSAGLVWSRKGDALFNAQSNGTLQLFTQASIRKAVTNGALPRR